MADPGIHGGASAQAGPAAADSDREAGFARAVKAALKHYVEPDRLRGNGLLGSRMVDQAAAGDPAPVNRIRALREVIVVHWRRLEAVPKTAGLAQILDSTYLTPECSQADAAKALGLPERTYRRHLARAVALLTAHLWETENHSCPPDAGAI